MDIHCSNRSTKDHNAFLFPKINEWLDKRAREMNIKFNLYNPPLNLFCLSKLNIKVLPTDSMKTRANFVVTKLFAVGAIFDTFSVVSHVFVFLFFLVFTYRELKQFYRLKMGYFRSIWNVLQSLLVLLILSCIVLFFLRLAMVEELLKSLEQNHERFVHFDSVVFVDNILANLIAFLVFLSWLRVTKFLKFNRRLSFLQETLAKMAKPLATYSVVFLTVFSAYVHSGYLLFSRELRTFNNFESTFTSLCSLFMGHFDFPSLQNSNRIIGPLFVFSALFFGGFIIINLLIVLVLESFWSVKTAGRPNQYELLEYVKKHLRYWFGATGKSTLRREELRDIISEKDTTRDSTLENSLVNPQNSNSSKEQQSLLNTRISKQETSLARMEKSVSGLLTSLECACAEDLQEEMMLYRLILKSLGLSCYKWLDHVRDLENVEDLEIALLRSELYEAVEKYSQELIGRVQNYGDLVSGYEERTLSTSHLDLNFEASFENIFFPFRFFFDSQLHLYTRKIVQVVRYLQTWIVKELDRKLAGVSQC